ncbi:GDSL-type esterase/lipase family protein [Lysobacter auxotrophicus]|uniref:GDSL-type esterase/lipase family protein n=1 Tax=Lysobacter auxotrophicus TaxID=2992573 RepID=A0ABN6UJH4_9GAMM|nr:GDSL-type esterase/lipase family protein [Lysobacter auxotrophicus]
MRPKSAALLLALLTAASFPAFAADGAADTVVDNVLIVGDSLSSAHRMEPSQGWVSLLQAKLATQTDTPPAIVNASRGGKTLTNALEELPALLTAHHPDVVVLELGGNDAILGAKRDAIERDLSRLIELSRAQGARVAILGFAVPPAFDKDGSADLLREAYVTVAKTQGIALLPSLLGDISTTPALLQDDGIHPNAAAQPRVLENAWPTLRPLLLGDARDGATVRTSGASK